MSKQLQNIGEQLLPAVAYGDAAGLPFEKKPPLDADSIDKLHDVLMNPFIGEYPAGTWSDDTQLSLAVSESLVRQQGFYLSDQANVHILALGHVKGELSKADWVPPIVTTERQNGWGRSTTKSIERLEQGVSPMDSGEPEGAGNGVLMKMAPLVYWQYVRETPPDQAIGQITDFTRMTHNSNVAEVCSQVHRIFLMQLLNVKDYELQENPDLLNYLYRDAIFMAKVIEDTTDPSRATSEVLARLEPKLVEGRPEKLHRDHILEAAPKNGFYAPETLLMAYGSFLIEHRFPESVYRAVELGGDADSIASIVGSMSLFLSGEIDKPDDFDKIFALERLERVSKKLTTRALRLH